MAITARVAVYRALIDSVDLRALVEDRVGAASSFNKQSERPLVAIRSHTDFPVAKVGRRQYIQVWGHDDPGDYMRIDEVLRLCRVAIEGIVPVDDLLEAKWIETSVDLRDDVMDSIARYSRFQLTFARREML